MTNFDVSKIPFSMAGSYMAVSDLPENYRWQENPKGLYLRTVRSEACVGPTKSTIIGRLVPTYAGEEIDYTYRATPDELVMETGKGNIRLCFADPGTILAKGEKSGLGLRVDFIPAAPFFTYLYEVPCEDYLRYTAVCFGQNIQYLLGAQEGISSMAQVWNGCTADGCQLHFQGENQGFLAVIRELAAGWDGVRRVYDYEACREETRKKFNDFCNIIHQVPKRYEETALLAAYVDWSCIVAKSGFLGRPAMYMSKNWMCSLWSWDHCFNAVALAHENPEAAWDQWILPFDHQDSTGLIPDNVCNSKVDWNYCKPPVQGWALSRMMRVMKLSEAQLAEAYDKLEKWTDWWLNYRDTDGDGVCEYNHGYDSGWDNATAFAEMPPVASPDLQAYLILQTDALVELAEKLGRKDQASRWKRRGEALLDAMVRWCFENGRPRVFHRGSHETVPTRSLLPYVAVLVGDRLPKELVENMVEVLKGPEFLTDYGFATESPASQLYDSDGYWRGPIWAPSTLLILDGLMKCGEEAFAREVAERFCRMVKDNGFAENFDALTGAGRRDLAYTWTPSVFLIFANEYLKEESEAGGR